LKSRRWNKMSEAFLFPSDKWVKEFCRKLNENKTYEEAAKNWEGDFLFIITPDGSLDREYIFYVDLWHGKCRKAELVGSREEKKTAYIFEGPYSNWKRLIRGELDPIMAIMTKKFKLQGDMSKVVRAVKAAKELVLTASKVPTQFK